jgi:hypothetical protein
MVRPAEAITTIEIAIEKAVGSRIVWPLNPLCPVDTINPLPVSDVSESAPNGPQTGQTRENPEG